MATFIDKNTIRRVAILIELFARRSFLPALGVCGDSMRASLPLTFVDFAAHYHFFEC